MDTEKFCEAVEIGNFAEIRELASSFENFDFANYYGMSPLDIAAQRGYLEIVHFLIEMGAYVDYSESATPLIFAIRENNLEIVKALVNAGADLEFESDLGTPLMESIGSSLEITNFLIESGARIDTFDEDGRTLIQVAAEIGREDIYEYLAKIFPESDVQEAQLSRLIGAIRQSNLSLITQILQHNRHNESIHEWITETLTTAVQHNQIEVIKEILSFEMFVELDGIEALTRASEEHNYISVCLLLEAGVDINTVDERGYTPLLCTVDSLAFNEERKINRLNLVRKFISEGANINHRNNSGKTALYYALERGDIDIIQILANAGAVE